MKAKATGTRRIFPFRIWYFDLQGKLHHEAIALWKVRQTDGEPNMQDALAKLRGLRRNGGQAGMPGGIDEGWPGAILLNCEGGYPCLLPAMLS